MLDLLLIAKTAEVSPETISCTVADPSFCSSSSLQSEPQLKPYCCFSKQI